jgi:hypothetical protein
MGCCIHSAFFIPMHPWQVEGSCRFCLVVERRFWCVWPAFCWVGHILPVCAVWMQSRWVYRWFWQSVLKISGIDVSTEGCISYPWKRWWKILVLGWGNPGHRGLWLCISGKPGLIVCLQDGDVNSGVVRDWCEWASDRLCDVGSRPFFSRCQCPGMEGVLLYTSWLLSFETLVFSTSSQSEGALVSCATLSWCDHSAIITIANFLY